jgi:hypothetical protein
LQYSDRQLGRGPEFYARAALGVIDSVGRLDVKSVELQARVGIATGLVVVGDLIGEGNRSSAKPPNLAARLQAWPSRMRLSSLRARAV